MPRLSNLALPRKLNDEDRYDFTVRTFAYVRTYFEGSLPELQARNPGTNWRLTTLSPLASKAIIFRTVNVWLVAPLASAAASPIRKARML